MPPVIPEDDTNFVNVWFGDQPEAPAEARKEQKGFYDEWVDQASAKHSTPELFGAHALRKLYPKHSLVMSEDYRLSLLDFPAAQIQALPTPESITNVIFMPLARRLGDIKGVLSQSVVFGAFDLTWKDYKFVVYIVRFAIGMSVRTQHFVLHDGPKGPAEELLLQAGLWQNQLHNEVWVFNQGFWSKNSSLWSEVQKSSWDDVVLKEEFKKALQKDIYSFFEAEEIYKELSIPWKRGLIMYGPPGNGKTISIKAIIKTCAERGLTPLYVKSFQSYKGEEGAMQDVFEKARQTAPCVLILEDLDSLINDRNRSFFLNQIDGLEGNDGLLVIGSTNHFDRLDPALSTRPSRFDRKYLFDDPDLEERVLYAKFWQNKLKANKRVSFPDTLVEEAAASTDQFSYAYLKEAFVATLVLLTSDNDEKPDFASLLLQQIASLRKELKKKPSSARARALPSISSGTDRKLDTPIHWQDWKNFNQQLSVINTEDQTMRSRLDKQAEDIRRMRRNMATAGAYSATASMASTASTASALPLPLPLPQPPHVLQKRVSRDSTLPREDTLSEFLQKAKERASAVRAPEIISASTSTTLPVPPPRSSIKARVVDMQDREPSTMPGSLPDIPSNSSNSSSIGKQWFAPSPTADSKTFLF